LVEITAGGEEGHIALLHRPHDQKFAATSRASPRSFRSLIDETRCRYRCGVASRSALTRSFRILREVAWISPQRHAGLVILGRGDPIATVFSENSGQRSCSSASRQWTR
jgi:hypothetical protein